MPIIQSQQLFTTESIWDVHINPSVMEGEHNNPSILGPGTAIEIERAPPVNIVAPYITGSTRIPETLTANPGSWTGSPSPQYRYRWFTDGVEIPNETSKTMVTFEELTDTDITVEVTGFSIMGESDALSAPFGVQLVEPVDLFEMGYYTVTGLGFNQHTLNTEVNAFVITGISVDQQQSIFELDVYAVEFL